MSQITIDLCFHHTGAHGAHPKRPQKNFKAGDTLASPGRASQALLALQRPTALAPKQLQK